MAQEKIDDLFQMAKDIAKAELELGCEKWVYITICRIDEFGDRKKLYEYDLRRDVYERRDWVIRWRESKLICKYPKGNIRCYFSYYDRRLGKDSGLNKDLSTLISCKAQVTKVQRSIDKYVAHNRTNNLFFDEGNDETLCKAKEKLAIKIVNVQAAEERLKQKIKELQNGNSKRNE